MQGIDTVLWNVTFSPPKRRLHRKPNKNQRQSKIEKTSQTGTKQQYAKKYRHIMIQNNFTFRLVLFVCCLVISLLCYVGFCGDPVAI